jgi:hypothetical protein
LWHARALAVEDGYIYASFESQERVIILLFDLIVLGALSKD